MVVEEATGSATALVVELVDQHHIEEQQQAHLTRIAELQEQVRDTRAECDCLRYDLTKAVECKAQLETQLVASMEVIQKVAEQRRLEDAARNLRVETDSLLAEFVGGSVEHCTEHTSVHAIKAELEEVQDRFQTQIQFTDIQQKKIDRLYDYAVQIGGNIHQLREIKAASK